ncbi:MAG: smalltalk protein [Bacteroides sp.]|nr:smalltalk protein [Bacteroides sp.]
MKDKEVWNKIIHVIITILTAVATTFGVSSCIS